ncbi:hypothetical protein V1T76_17390 [Roseibium sp. FZY0029]|uniref:hypothetical protein n=1 Tax=Roseibium sp. FZY0029 TaxID=3116647 RepID=UPI002EA74A83|nr:hypothetical protein [Roseibium sp. FZY0029]
MGNHFATQLDWRSLQDTLKISQDHNYFGEQLPIPSEIEMIVRRRFSDIFLTAKALEHSRGKSFYVEKEARIRQRNRKTVKIIDTRNHKGVRRYYFDKKYLEISSINKIITSNTNEDFTLDQSIPYYKPSEPYEFALADLNPFFSDPDKLGRAAAFAGWAILSSEFEQNEASIIKHLQKRRRLSLRFSGYGDENYE